MTILPESREPLLRFLTVQSKLDRELATVLAEAAADTEKLLLRLGSGSVRSNQLLLVLRDIRRIQQELWVQGVGEAIGDRLQDAETAAERAARALDTFLVDVAGRRRAETLIDAFTRQVERGLVVDQARIPQELSSRVYRNAELSSGRIERIIRSSIIRGMSAREIADQVKPLINPNVRGGVSHAAMRLGRTELNNAFHAQQIQEAERPWVNGVKWNLSKSHPKKDDCDSLASHDEGLGRGVWAKRRVPSKPHPQCLCYMTYAMVSPEEALDLILANVS